MLRSAALALAALALPAAARAQAAPPATGTQLVDVMNTLWGRHAGLRANHAKGVVVEGVFTPSKDAAGLSRASIFAGAPVPVTVRFSDSTGLPAIPDGAAGANPHGMAIQFHTASGGQVDVVTNSLPFFPVATGTDFYNLLTAISQSGPGAKKPTAFETFVAAHPSVPAAFGALHTPASFATEIYNGVDAFVFVDASGKRQPFRFRIVPDGGTSYLTASQAAKAAPGFLVDGLADRLARAPAQFALMAQLADPGDKTRDPTKPWPATRRMVDIGTITLTTVDADQVKAAANLRLLPNVLEPGIEVSDDPLISARVQAYVISFGRRAH